MRREHKKKLTNAELRIMGLTPGLIVRRVRKPQFKEGDKNFEMKQYLPRSKSETR